MNLRELGSEYLMLAVLNLPALLPESLLASLMKILVNRRISSMMYVLLHCLSFITGISVLCNVNQYNFYPQHVCRFRGNSKLILVRNLRCYYFFCLGSPEVWHDVNNLNLTYNLV
jgi:hypothetical protein